MIAGNVDVVHKVNSFKVEAPVTVPTLVVQGASSVGSLTVNGSAVTATPNHADLLGLAVANPHGSDLTQKTLTTSTIRNILSGSNISTPNLLSFTAGITSFTEAVLGAGLSFTVAFVAGGGMPNNGANVLTFVMNNYPSVPVNNGALVIVSPLNATAASVDANRRLWGQWGAGNTVLVNSGTSALPSGTYKYGIFLTG